MMRKEQQLDQQVDSCQPPRIDVLGPTWLFFFSLPCISFFPFFLGGLDTISSDFQDPKHAQGILRASQFLDIIYKYIQKTQEKGDQCCDMTR